MLCIYNHTQKYGISKNDFHSIPQNQNLEINVAKLTFTNNENIQRRCTKKKEIQSLLPSQVFHQMQKKIF